MLTKYRITPLRIGRRDDIAPFVVVVDDTTEDHAQALAEGLHNWAKDYLLSTEFSVQVDLGKKKFSIEGGRFGKGTIQIKEVEEDVAGE